MALDWPSEQYVRLYTRNTPGWLVAPWEGRALLPLLIRALDRNGHLDLGDDPIEGLAATVMLPLEVVEVGLAYWVKRQTVVWSGTVLQMPNYVSAQECTKSDKLRAQEYRARKRVTMRDEASQFVTDTSRIVTERHEKSRDVTRANASSHSVTPPVLCFPVPPNPPTPPPATPGAPTGADRPRGDPSRRGTRAPVSTAPEATAFCQRWSLPPPSDDECRSFLDYWGARTGQGSTKLDWTATWRNRPSKTIPGAIQAARNRSLQQPPAPGDAPWRQVRHVISPETPQDPFDLEVIK